MPSIQQDILRDDSKDKRPLISESVAMIQISVHPTGTNMPYVWPLRSHVQQPSKKSLLSQTWALALGMKFWPLAIIRPGRHPKLPHSPSNKPP
jgi:hypothetical protein